MRVAVTQRLVEVPERDATVMIVQEALRPPEREVAGTR
jgi:hypothetical protein